MKLLIVSKDIHIIQAKNGAFFINHHFDEEIFKRYLDICDELTLYVRESEQIISFDDAVMKYNKFDISLMRLFIGPYIYSPKTNFFNIRLRIELANEIKRLVKETDKLICTEGFCVFSRLAVKYAKRYKKPYMLLCGSFVYEGLVAHSFLGKIRAPFEEFMCKRNFKEAPYTMYVTQSVLQKRYPCNGKSIGCSDVEISLIDDERKNAKIERIKNIGDRKLIIGTLGYIDNPVKGQAYVIEAMKRLVDLGFTNYEYQIVGSGNGNRLKRLIAKYGLEDKVKIIGPIPHRSVFMWLDSLDIYIQPSLTEGLVRAVIEAMSRVCPVAGSATGGMVELIDPQYSFSPGNIDEIVAVIQKLSQPEHMEQAIIYSYNKAKEFSPEILSEKRNAFLRQFMLTEFFGGETI